MHLFGKSALNNQISGAAFALMITLAFLPLMEGGFDHEVIYWVLLLLTAVSIFLCFKEKWQIVVSQQEPLLWYALFVIWAGLSIFWSLNPHRTLVEFLQLACYGLVYLLATRLDEHNFYRVGRMALIAGVGIAAFGISQYLFLALSRIRGTFPNPNPLGIFLVMLFFVAWGCYLRRSGRLLAATSLVLMVALVLTGSRGALICFLLAFPLLFLGFKGKNLGKSIGKTILCISFTLILVQGIMLIAPYLHENVGANQLVHFLTRPESFIATSGVGRLAFWEVGARLALAEPVRGHGLGSFFLAYFLEHGGDKWYSRFAHNHYLQTAAELGLVGVGLLIGFIVTMGKAAYKKLIQQKNMDYYPGALAAMLAFLIHSGVDFSWNFPGTAVIFFALAGATARTAARKEITITLNYKLIASTLMILLLLTSWQFSAIILYREGIRLESQGKIAAANKIYAQANAIYPINAMAFSFASNNYIVLSQKNEEPALLEKALTLAQRAVSLSPVDAILQNRLGKIYWQLGYSNKAEQHLKLATEYAGHRLGMYLDLGWFYFQQERHKEAEKILLAGLELKKVALESAVGQEKERVFSRLVDFHLILANIYQVRGEDGLARYYFEKTKE